MRGSSFRHVDDRRLGERLEPLQTQLGPEAGLLRAGVGDVRSEIEMLVHPLRAGVNPGRHSECPVAVRRPDRAAQAELRVVRPVAGLITSRVSAPSTSFPLINNLKSLITCAPLITCRPT